MGLLEGRYALVTGASRGIGRAIAEAFAREGASVGINYQRSEKAARAVLKNVESAGSRGVLLKGDVSDSDDVKRVVSSFLEFSGRRLDILVNNAGIYERGRLDEMPPESWSRTMDTNVNGAYSMTISCLPYLQRSGRGRIIFMSSQLAFTGSDHGAAYVASKAALLGFARALALELACKNVTVNAIAPGTIDTDLLSSYTAKMRTEKAAGIPMGRLGEPGEVAGAAVFLASDLASYVTGEVLMVSGGSASH